MKRSISTLIFLVIAFAAVSVYSQPSSSGSSKRLPFAVGESLTYDGKISKVISVPFGDIKLEVAKATNEGTLELKFDARSRGSLIKLFYTFIQEIDTIADAGDLRAISSRKNDVQKKRIRKSVTAFDYKNRMVTWVETNPEEPINPPRTIASDLEGPTYDIVTALYFVRTLPMSVGYSTSVNVSDSGLVYKIPLLVAARERQKTIFGDVWCWRVEPQVFGPNRFFEQKGKMEIWITDDARRIPVRARANAEVGKIDIRLKQATNLK